ncbi:MAG: guanylate kinase [Gammaproteobacteria bacterium]|nr:guanylate kinase [Gammaproteobacteria bacterium]
MERVSHQAQVFILSAPSGGGKSSLARALAENCDHVMTSVSHTTRNIRPGETDGVDYNFVDVDTFERMIAGSEFVEYANVFGQYYGTSRDAIVGNLAAGKSVVLDIDWQGARQVRDVFKDAVSIYILPPSLEVLAARLSARGREDDQQLQERLSKASSEMSHFNEYDYLMINTHFEDALLELENLVLRGKRPTSADNFDVKGLV